MSLFADYLKERTSDCILETEYGFATYRFIDPKTVYIIDIYVIPESRQLNLASSLADKIVEEAKKRGCSRLLGSVVPSNKGSTGSLRVLLAYDMKLESSGPDFIVFSKEII